MKIEKKYQGTIPTNKILNEKTESNTDTYSCEYINNKVEKSYIQCGLTKHIDIKSGTATQIIFDNNYISGDLFSYDSENNEIVVNENANSGKMKLSLRSFITAVQAGSVPLIAYNILINDEYKVIANTELATSTSRNSICHDVIIDYNAGDKIKMEVTASANSFQILGTFNRTLLTLEEL